MSGIWETITTFGQTIITTIASSSIIFSQTMPTTPPSPTPAIPVSEQANSAVKTLNGNYTIAGQNLTYQLSIPINGGSIVGSFSGSCQGTISGNYKKTDEIVAGQAEGTCQIGIIQTPINLEYAGQVDPNNQKVNINWQLTKPISQQGSTNLPFNP